MGLTIGSLKRGIDIVITTSTTTTTIAIEGKIPRCLAHGHHGRVSVGVFFLNGGGTRV
jgi:hypothetical protein